MVSTELKWYGRERVFTNRLKSGLSMRQGTFYIDTHGSPLIRQRCAGLSWGRFDVQLFS